MSDISINPSMNQVLAQMRALSQAAGPMENPAAAQGAAGSGPDFARLLDDTLREVTDMQQTAAANTMAFQRGEPDVDIARVMISLEKASVAFDAVTQTRNRLLSAYKDIMNMPV